MDIKSNISGTLAAIFQIGKRGPSIRQGNAAPLNATGTNGDIFLLQGDGDLLMRRAGEWKSLGSDRVFKTTFTGNDILTSFTITHNFDTRDVVVHVREDFGSHRDVEVSVSRPDDNSVILAADDPIPNGLTYRVIVEVK